MSRRQLFWIAFLAVSAVLALVPMFFDEPMVEAAPRARPPQPAQPVARRVLVAMRPPGGPAAAAAPRATAATAQSGAGRDGLLAEPTADLFAAHSWEPPAPPPPPPAAPAPPVAAPAPAAPPLPFTYFGRLDDSRRVQVFLARGEQVFSVGEGDVIDGAYAVTAVTETQLTMIYLPLNLPQTMALGRQP